MTGVSPAAPPHAGNPATPHSGWIWPDDVPVARPLLKSAKLLMLRSASRSGLSDVVRASAWRCRRLLILAYHGISMADEHEWSPELYLPPGALRARFELIRDGGYNVVPLREGVERLRAGTLPPGSVALTFDDGMVDFMTEALPLLQEFQFPATVFATTYYAQKQVPVFRIACRYMLWMGRDRTISGDELTADGQPLELRTEHQRHAALVAIEHRLMTRKGGVDEELATLRRLAERVGADFDRFIASRKLQIMSPEEIRSLPRDLVEVQLHTHRHRVPLRETSFQREIIENRRALSAWRPDEVLDVFCYPSGVTDRRFLPWLWGMDIRTGLTCEAGMATSRTNPLLLPRLVDSTGMTRLEFESWLSGVGTFIPRLRRRGLYGAAAVPD
jgi:peptidoglycan/xylan/chitin deacetylase (PgdA/CDA1 family)